MEAYRCQICAGRGDSSRKLHCTSCTRAVLYPLRLDLARSLLERERLAARIPDITNAGISAESNGTRTSRTEAERERCIESLQQSTASMQIKHSTARMQAIHKQTCDLKEHTRTLRTLIDEKKADLGNRKKWTAQAVSRLGSSDFDKRILSGGIGNVDPTVPVSEQTTKSRRMLLNALGYWTRLERRPCKDGNGAKTFEYSLAGLKIPDLRDLAQAKDGDEDDLTAVLASICRLLHLAARYLQIRLPAELIVPHRNWPLPMIMSPLSSYSGRVVPFPYKALYSSSTRASRNEPSDDHSRSLPRPRPLFLLRPIKSLASDDSGTYSRFVEAIGLLAWNVAFLCRTQGLNVSQDDWTDVCDIGKNLWTLVVESTGDSRGIEAEHKVGVYSHGSAHNYLRAGPLTGTLDTSVRGWALGNPIQILTELRAHLSSEIAMSEAVMVEGYQTAENGLPNTDDGRLTGEEPTEFEQGEQATWTKGWLKLRRRA